MTTLAQQIADKIDKRLDQWEKHSIEFPTCEMVLIIQSNLTPLEDKVKELKREANDARQSAFKEAADSKMRPSFELPKCYARLDKQRQSDYLSGYSSAIVDHEQTILDHAAKEGK